MNPRILAWNQGWREPIAKWVQEQMANADPGHGLEHVERVVQNTILLASHSDAEPFVYLPAAWLHDCVTVAKNSENRPRASRMAASMARQFLVSIAYPTQWIDAVVHCIESHSFSARIDCQSLEAEIVQDADRLEALGAIGLARCLMTGGAMGQRLYHPTDPFPTDREPQDTQQSVDHFFAKLLGLDVTMKTEAGRREAAVRKEFLIAFLRELAREANLDQNKLDQAIANVVSQ